MAITEIPSWNQKDAHVSDFQRDTPVSDFQKEDIPASSKSETGVNARFQPKDSTPSCLTKRQSKCNHESNQEQCVQFKWILEPKLIKEMFQREISWHTPQRVSCHAPWKGDHDGTLTEHTAEDTLDKSRRRDTMFPHSFCVTSVSQ